MSTHPAAGPSDTPPLLRCAAALCLLMLCSLDVFASTLNVTLVPSRGDGAYQRVLGAIVNRIGEQPAADISLKIVNLDELRKNGREIDQAADLFIPIGIRATEHILRQAVNSPVLAVLVLRSSFNATLKRSTEKTPAVTPSGTRRISAILLDQPVNRQLHLTRLLFGTVKRIGIPLGPDSQPLRAEIADVAQRLELSIEIENIDSADRLMQQLTQLMERSDVLLAFPDPLIFNRRNVRYILLSSYRKRIPVIGYSQSYVKAGALAATYSSPEQIGKQAAEAIIELQRNPSLRFPGIMAPTYFSVAINDQVARAFGYMNLSAQDLAQQIRQLEHNPQ